MNPHRSEDAILQNLEDAGCDSATVKAFLSSYRNGDRSQGIRLLEKHRRVLLDGLHREQERIDCLDYLLFQLHRQARQGPAR